MGPACHASTCPRPFQVQFKRWADAERAMLAVNGTSPLENGKGRPLVCHFANPRRTVGSQVSETAIAPRKLFVGQASTRAAATAAAASAAAARLAACCGAAPGQPSCW